MGKKILVLGLAIFLFLSFNTVYAKMSDADYHTRISQLNQSIKDAHHNFIMQKDQARKDALDQLGKLGNSKADLASRKTIMKNTKKKVSDLREKYTASRKMLLDREKALREARRQEQQEAAKARR